MGRGGGGGVNERLTALQQAQALLQEARPTAEADGRRTYLAWLEITAANVAAEIARLTDWSEAT
jgi:hypothetical protein